MESPPCFGTTALLTLLRFCFFVIIFLCFIEAGTTQQKLGELLVYGDDFLFSVQEPAGWTGDTENAAKFEANVVLHEAGEPRNSYKGLIRVSLNDKTDENVSADMAADMREYKTRYPKVQFKNLSINHPNYKCLSEVFYVPGDFYEYVAYVNPDPKRKIMFSASMNTGKTEATAKELAAYESAIKSLTLLKP